MFSCAAMSLAKRCPLHPLGCRLAATRHCLRFESSHETLAWYASALSFSRHAFSSRVRSLSTTFPQDLSVNVLPVRGAEDLGPADYKLVFGETMLSEDGLPILYILAPKVCCALFIHYCRITHDDFAGSDCGSTSGAVGSHRLGG